MTAFFKLIVGFICEIVILLDELTFDFFGYDVSYFGLLVVFIIIGFVINVFWKGARS